MEFQVPVGRPCQSMLRYGKRCGDDACNIGTTLCGCDDEDFMDMNGDDRYGDEPADWIEERR